MAKPRNHGKRWTAAQKRTVWVGAKKGETTTALSRKLHRTKAAIRAQASRQNVSLMPKD